MIVEVERRPGRRYFSILWLLCLLCISQAGYPQAVTDDKNPDEVTLNFEKADIEAFISAVSQITGKSFIVDPRVKGKITIISGSALPPEAIYQVFLSVLEVHQFSAVESGDIVKIIPLSEIKGVPTRTSFGDPGDNPDEQITQVYQLQHVSANELTPLLRPLLPPTSHFAVHTRTNTLIITDVVANIRRVLDIIRKLDQPNRHSDIHIVFLKHAKAAKLSQVISQLASSIQVENDPANSASPNNNSVVVQADPETNALIIQAPPSEFAKLEAVITELDRDQSQPANIHVLYLKHAKAKDLTAILNSVAESKDNATEGVAESARTSIQADEQTNALIIRAGEEGFDELKTVIDKLDIRRAQVYVEMIIAEVTEGKEADIGVEWTANLSPGLDYQSGITREQTSGSTNFSDQAGGISLGFINRFVYDLAGNLVPDLGVVLKALRSNASTNILSTPNLLTLNNESAEISVGQEVPFVTGQFVTDASSSITNTGSADDPTVTGVVNPFQTIERKDVGLSLKITPQINEGNVIQLDIEQTISNVSRTAVQGASDLITDNRSITTKVLVDDGQIIVLGGLIRDSLVDSYEYVPGLGKIPLLGALFRRKSKQNAKTNLMVFLRPKVIRSHADMLELTHGKYKMMLEMEGLSQGDTRDLIKEAKTPTLPEIDWETGKPIEVVDEDPMADDNRLRLSDVSAPGKK